jgi:hypothetical protein
MISARITVIPLLRTRLVCIGNQDCFIIYTNYEVRKTAHEARIHVGWDLSKVSQKMAWFSRRIMGLPCLITGLRGPNVRRMFAD